MSDAGNASQSTGRRPRGIVKINGKQTLPLKFHVLSNSHFQCDQFSFTLEAFQQPDGFGMEFWGGDGAKGCQAEIFIGFLESGDDEDATPSNLQSLLLGQVDDVEVDMDGGEVHLAGRDLTALLIDTKISQTWPDHTASQIVTDLAGQAGLAPQVTATSTPTGSYSKGQYAALGRDVPMWDLITYLAEQEGFDAYVTGRTLYFGPPQADTDSSPLSLSYSRDAQTGAINISSESLKLKRALTLAKDLTVTVLSYDRGKKTPIKAVAKRQGSAKSASTSFRQGSTSQNYTIRRAGLTQAQALQLAQKMLADLSDQERTIEAEIPTDDGTLTSRKKARVTGTDTSWDTDYFIDTITREFGFGEYRCTITGKNHQVESQPDL